MKEGKILYCYGIVEEEISLKLRGFEEGEVDLVSFKDIKAVVSYVSEENFSQEAVDKNIKKMGWLTEKVQLHEQVIEAVMEKTTIIPMKFCTIFKTAESLKVRLEEKYADFKYNLQHLKGKVEMGVKVYFETEPLKQKLLGKSTKIKDLHQEIQGIKQKSPGVAYFAQQKMEILIKEEVRQELAQNKKEIFDKIKSLAEEAKQNELLNKKVTGKEMLLNSVFLIREEEIEKFKEEVNKIKPKYPQLSFELWGPFPAYNFVN